MKTIIILLALFVSSSFAINGYTLNKRYIQGDTVTATNLTANFDSGKVWSTKIADTLNKKTMKFSGQVMKDSTCHYLKLDTLKAANTSIKLIGAFNSTRLITDTVQVAKLLYGNGLHFVGFSTMPPFDSLYPTAYMGDTGISAYTAFASNHMHNFFTVLDTSISPPSYVQLFGVSKSGGFLQMNLGSTTILRDNSDSYFNGSTSKLGIRKSPSYVLDVSGAINSDSIITSVATINGNIAVVKVTASDSVKGTVGKFTTGLKVGTGTSIMQVYVDTTFPCSLYSNSTVRSIGVAHLVETGTIITISFPPLYGLLDSNYNYVKGISQSRFISINGDYKALSVPIVDKKVPTTGVLSIGEWLYVSKANGNFLGADSGGLCGPIISGVRQGVIVTILKQ